MTQDTADIVERAAWGRARAATALALVFIATQAVSFHEDPVLSRPALVHLIAYVFWAAALLFFLATGGGLFRSAKTRALLNDETTLDHRRRAMVWGFWAALGAALIIFAVTLFEPLTAREGARFVITIAVAAALLRFGKLEKEALKDG